MADAPSTPPPSGFGQLGLPDALLQALSDNSYEEPTAIQQQAIPFLLEGADLLGHAPTGTGKTAAFALPLLARLDLKAPQVQVLVLTPTRELAQQVAAAFERYAAHLRRCEVLPVYGGQGYGDQVHRLRRGVHVVVGTPGRIKDHLTRGTLRLDNLQALVLDEADEMLRMGFIDDVQWIIEQAPQERQVALFSATMPPQIQRIGERYLRQPREVSIASKTATAETIQQRYWTVGGMSKIEALSRLLEVEPCDGVLVFVRTRNATTEVAERLSQRGFNASPMNGDLPQAQREQMVAKFKRGGLDVLVATDVAARGLDVERVSHVINFDIPFDTEAYVHRIGRTGRAGRSGQAILFVTPRERRMLRNIERATRQPIGELKMPTLGEVNAQRVHRFKARIGETLAADDLTFLREVVAEFVAEHDVEPELVAAALARMATQTQPLQVEHEPKWREPRQGVDSKPRNGKRGADMPRRRPERAERSEARGAEAPARTPRRREAPPPQDSERFRLEVGATHGVQTGNIVGAIANEADIDSQFIGRVDIRDDHTIIELPTGMPREVFKSLRKVWVCGQQLQLSRLVEKPSKRMVPGDVSPNVRSSARSSEPNVRSSARSSEPNVRSGKRKPDGQSAAAGEKAPRAARKGKPGKTGKFGKTGKPPSGSRNSPPPRRKKTGR